MRYFTPDEVAALVEAGYTPEEISEYQEEENRRWENLKRLWDGKPQISKPKRRIITDDWIVSNRSNLGD